MKLIVFDLDGTLVDSQQIIVASMRAAVAQHDLPPPDDAAIRRIVGLRLVDGVARLAPALDPVRHATLALSYREAFHALRTAGEINETLFPDVRAMLEDLARAGFTLGIATGKSRRGLMAVLEHHALLPYFVTLQTGDEPPGKPHPAMLLRAIAAAGVAPAATAMIGDTSFDMAMAVAAGALPIGVAWGYHATHELTEAGAVHLVSRCPDIVPLIAALAGPCSPLDPVPGPSESPPPSR
jgi:phosphoglycolate phosphatase